MLHPHLEAGLPGKVPAALVDGAVVGQDVDELEAVALAGRKIVGVVRWRDFDGTRPEGHVNQLRVGDDGDLAPVQRMHHVLAMQVRIPANAVAVWISPLSIVGQRTQK